LHFSLLSFANCAILHPLFFWAILLPIFLSPFWFCTPFVFNCTFAPYLFANCVILHLLFFFLRDFAPHLLPNFPSFWTKHNWQKMRCKIAKKKQRGYKIAQLAINKGKKMQLSLNNDKKSHVITNEIKYNNFKLISTFYASLYPHLHILDRNKNDPKMD